MRLDKLLAIGGVTLFGACQIMYSIAAPTVSVNQVQFGNLSTRNYQQHSSLWARPTGGGDVSFTALSSYAKKIELTNHSTSNQSQFSSVRAQLAGMTPVTYYPYSAYVSRGVAVGNYSSRWRYGTKYYRVNEVTGANGMQFYAYFRDVTSFNKLQIHEQYAGSTAHNVEMSLYNNVSGLWDLIDMIPTQTTLTAKVHNILTSDLYILNGQATVRFNHPASGVGTHYMITDYLSLAQDSGTGVTEHGLLTGLADDDHTQYAIRNRQATFANLTATAIISAKLTTPEIIGGTGTGDELELKGSSSDATAVTVSRGTAYGNFSGGTVKATSIPMLVSHEQNGSSHVNGIASFISPISSNTRSRAAILKNYTSGAYSDVVTVTGNQVLIGTPFAIATGYLPLQVANDTGVAFVAQRNSTSTTAQQAAFVLQNTLKTKNTATAFGMNTIMSDGALTPYAGSQIATIFHNRSAGKQDSSLLFKTNGYGTLNSIERLRVTSRGLIGVGTTTPRSTFDNASSAAGKARATIGSGANYIIVGQDGTSAFGTALEAYYGITMAAANSAAKSAGKTARTFAIWSSAGNRTLFSVW